MNRKHFALFLLLTTSLLLAFAAQQRTKAAALSEPSDTPLLELVGSASVDSKPNSMIIRCEGFRCGRYHELVYWGFDNKIYFLNAHSLTPTSSPLLTSGGMSSCFMIAITSKYMPLTNMKKALSPMAGIV